MSLEKLTSTELHDRLNDAIEQMLSAEAALTAVYQEFDSRQGRLDSIAANKSRSQYDFGYIKWLAAKAVGRVIDAGLAHEIFRSMNIMTCAACWNSTIPTSWPMRS